MRNPYYLYDVYVEYLNKLKKSDDATEVEALSFQDWIAAFDEYVYYNQLAISKITERVNQDEWSDMDEEQAELNRFIENYDEPRNTTRVKPVDLVDECQMIMSAYTARKSKGLYVKDLDVLYETAVATIEAIKKAQKAIQASRTVYAHCNSNNLHFDKESYQLQMVQIPSKEESSDELPF